MDEYLRDTQDQSYDDHLQEKLHKKMEELNNTANIPDDDEVRNLLSFEDDDELMTNSKNESGTKDDNTLSD